MFDVALIMAIYVSLAIIVIGGILSLWGWGASKYRAWVGQITILALVLVVLSLAVRMWEAGRLPVSSMYDFILLFTAATLAVFIIINTRCQSPYLPMLAAMLGLVLISAGSAFPQEARPLMPALQSGWLKFHVITAVIAYGLFGIAFCLGLIYLFGLNTINSPSRNEAGLIYQLVGWGEFFMTLVLITGAVWAEEVWGSWWSWDPKETWALVTWLIYAAYLHAYRIRGWRGRKSVFLVVVGFLVVMFTLFGVSVLLPGNHSYL